MRTALYNKQVKEIKAIEYRLCHYLDFDYQPLSKVPVRSTRGTGHIKYHNMIIMADTETSKSIPGVVCKNHVVCWSMAIRAEGHNIVTLYGRRPSELWDCVDLILKATIEHVFIFFHNLGYDHVFLRKFMLAKFGKPKKQLNTKPYCPLYIAYDRFTVKDSLMLAQRSLDKWANDMEVEHKKALGSWDYEKIRNQDTPLSEDEMTYIEHDVLAGVECIDAQIKGLKTTLGDLPLTATGIVRRECRERGRRHHAHDHYKAQSPAEWSEQEIFEKTFHGGYTHANRHCVGLIYPAKARDFASKYPAELIGTHNYPIERFFKLEDNEERVIDKDYILRNSAEYCFIFRVTAVGVTMRDDNFPMPTLASSKCDRLIKPLMDNGRVLECDAFEAYMTEVDFELFDRIYQCDEIVISDVRCAAKGRLPKWFTDYVFDCFRAKTQLKGVDGVLYAIEKAKLNSNFGMCAQKPCKEDIIEQYDNTEEPYDVVQADFETIYQQHLNSRNSFLPYAWGIYCTANAMKGLYDLGACVPEGERWLYSDTDSVYATDFDPEKLKVLNDRITAQIKEAGYGGVIHEQSGKEYHLGVAEDDGEYMQFVCLHSKCYCARPLVAYGEGFIMGGDLKITVAGVPKKGAKSLKNNIKNFHPGFIFPGHESGKLTHTHFYVDAIYTDECGNECGDSIDLSPCDYKVGLDDDAEKLERFLDYGEEVKIIDYEAQEE